MSIIQNSMGTQASTVTSRQTSASTRNDMLERIKRSFNSAESSHFYGRDREIAKLREFIESDRDILHVTGNPGTGKTAAIRHALRNEEYEYMNYYYTPSVYSNVRKTSKRFVVIDEYDKFFDEKKSECRKVLILLKKNRQRLITIGNDLKHANVEFLPYTKGEIVGIIEKKIAEEIGASIMSRGVMEMISKKFENKGSMRACFKFILGCYESKSLENSTTANNSKVNSINETSNANGINETSNANGINETSNANGINENKLNNISSRKAPLNKEKIDGCLYLNIKDVVREILPVENERNMQHDLIRRFRGEKQIMLEAYGMYIKECKAVGIPAMDRTDFQILYDLESV